MTTAVPSVQMLGITKRFPGVLANDHIDFSANAGEIHALLGENGAGKSTLMNILSGLYHPDQGDIHIHGRRVALRSPRDAISLGIGMVHQHFMLVEPHTVAENVTLGLDEPRFLLNSGQIEQKIAALSEKYGLKVDPEARIWQLSVGEQQRVEIIKMLYRNADILILDEPTAVLTPQEARELFVTLKRMAAEGHTIIFITHKLDEVMAISDRVTVLRKGRVVSTVFTSATNKQELARMMVGREVFFQVTKRPWRGGSAVLRVEAARALSDKGLPALKGVSFEVQEGEILGVAGVAGNGQRELAEAITGLRPLTSGEVYLCDRRITNHNPRQILDQKVSHIPEDRLGMGLIPNLSLSDNLILKGYFAPPLGRGPFLDQKAIDAHCRELISRFEVMAPGPDSSVKLLSGGNLQRLLLAREISCCPRLMVAVHPTRGLDVGATEAVHKMVLEQREEGAAILLISEDLDELLSLSDRVAVLYEGEIMGIVPAQGAQVEEIGLMMAGAKRIQSVEVAAP
ncbi:MAG: ABC transporter ATP-binding protein [Chloroflexota bacterium]